MNRRDRGAVVSGPVVPDAGEIRRLWRLFSVVDPDFDVFFGFLSLCHFQFLLFVGFV
jgi:hypothetical protein